MELLKVNDLHTFYHLGGRTMRAVDGVSFSLDESESLGLVGESGCGKTTTALSVVRLLPDNAEIAGGSIEYRGEDIVKMSRGKVRATRWKEISIIFQGAMNALNPVLTVGRQITEAILLHENVTKQEADKRAAKLFEMVEIDPKRLGNYPHEFSGGMKQRAMIAMALSCNPKIIIGDEPTTALDVMVQAQIFDLIERLRKELKLSMILITHDLSVLADTCDRAAIMYAGKIVEIGTMDDIFYDAAHPYTRLLLAAFPHIRGERVMIDSIPGTPPKLFDPPAGCRFCDRCPDATEICRTKIPPETALSATHRVSCHRVVKNT